MKYERAVFKYIASCAVALLYACAAAPPLVVETPPPSTVTVVEPPPPLPIYEQPICPGPRFVWTPGYWAYGVGGYYWVPGTWVLAPRVGVLWTPAFWGWEGGVFVFHAGYWGPHVGFYGGINYGFGYGGVGYEGGYWNNGALYYNTAVNNVNVTNIHNTYNTTVVNNTTVSNVSYNGSNGGTNAQPTTEEKAAASESHIPPTSAQAKHEHLASTNQSLLASQNHGTPPIAATPRPTAFHDQGVVPAKQAAITPQKSQRENLGAVSPPTQGAAAKSQPEDQPRTRRSGAQQNQKPHRKALRQRARHPNPKGAQ